MSEASDAQPASSSSKGRDTAFARARTLNDTEEYEQAVNAIRDQVGEDPPLTKDQVELLNWIIIGRITSCGFGDEKKNACYDCIELLEQITLVKEATWLQLYADMAYDCFNKINRFVRDEERDNIWCRLKELYLEIVQKVRKVWRDKNSPERLAFFVLLAKLCKAFSDVADDETIKLVSDEAKEAKYMGKASLDDESWREANSNINDIKKAVSECEHQREQSGQDE